MRSKESPAGLSREVQGSRQAWRRGGVGWGGGSFASAVSFLCLKYLLATAAALKRAPFPWLASGDERGAAALWRWRSERLFSSTFHEAAAFADAPMSCGSYDTSHTLPLSLNAALSAKHMALRKNNNNKQ